MKIDCVVQKNDNVQDVIVGVSWASIAKNDAALQTAQEIRRVHSTDTAAPLTKTQDATVLNEVKRTEGAREMVGAGVVVADEKQPIEKTQKIRVGSWNNKTFTWIEEIDPNLALPTAGPSEGRVKEIRGKWGFIKDSKCPSYDLFFHMSEVDDEWKSKLKRGSVVKYQINRDQWRNERKSKFKAIAIRGTGAAVETNEVETRKSSERSDAGRRNKRHMAKVPCRADQSKNWRAEKGTPTGRKGKDGANEGGRRGNVHSAQKHTAARSASQQQCTP
jgi:cold shock CspA family protein